MLLRWIRSHQLPLVYGLILGVFWTVGVHRYDPDFGWHLTSGQYFLAHGIPATDIFSYTAPDFPWVNHEWFADILLALVYSIGGYTLLAFLYAGLWTGGIALASRFSGPWFVLLFTAIAMVPYSGVRATSWTILLTGLLIFILGSARTYWKWMVPLFFAWANVHGGFAIGLAYVGYVALRRRSPHLVVLGVLSVLATLLTPYGIETYVEIIRTMADPTLKSNVTEWMPFRLDMALAPITAFWLVAVIAESLRHWRRYIRFDIGLFAAAMSANRHIPLFALFSLPRTTAFYSSLPAIRIRKQDYRLFWVVGGVVAVAFCGLIWTMRDNFTGEPDATYAPAAAAFLNENPCRGNLFNHYDVGGYLIWKVPGQKLYIDGRMPSWRMHGKHFMTDYYRTENEASFRKQEFAKYNVRCVLWPKGKALSRALIKEGWHIIPEASDSYELFVK